MADQRGRPTKYTKALQKQAEAYVSDYESHGDVVPTIAGLACVLDVDRSTCYEWAERHEDFSYIFTRVEQLQERRLVNGGLAGNFNPAVTKMLLTKHGYSDRTQQEHTSPDGSMGPTRIEIVSPDDDDG